jgi:mono/diheme cytochrome c family protein
LIYNSGMHISKRLTLICFFLVAMVARMDVAFADEDAHDELFDGVANIFRQRCLSCHNDEKRGGGLSLQSAESVRIGGDSGQAIEAGSPDDSYLMDMIHSDDGQPFMPQDADPLTAEQVELISKWIKAGARWPAGKTISLTPPVDLNWWSLKPLVKPAVPEIAADQQSWAASPVDAFIAKAYEQHGLNHAEPATRRQLIRRLYYDLIGLPPTPEQIDAFENNPDPNAYAKLVDELLDSPQYGERWARHWLDLVQYADTHGYDKDKMRENAWPYRDYVIQSFNMDKPYHKFVREQIAGDALFPNSPHGQIATGFLSAGPWDFIGHAEVPESKIDGKIARLLDRDDMVSTTMNTFVSTTVQCARCHHHKFDPVHQEHYYALHAVFAALDRADKPYDTDSRVASQRASIREHIADTRLSLKFEIGKENFAKLERLMAMKPGNQTPEYGWHSRIEMTSETETWLQFEFDEIQTIDSMMLHPAYDEFNDIGAGFGFPVRFKIEISDDPEFKTGSTVVFDQTKSDFSSPGNVPIEIDFGTHKRVKHIRITATKLFERKSDFNFALAEVVFKNSQQERLEIVPDKITSSGSIDSPPRWQAQNLFDQQIPISTKEISNEIIWLVGNPSFENQFELLNGITPENLPKSRSLSLYEQLVSLQQSLENLPEQSTVYSATVYAGDGNFRGRAGLGPREIHVLNRGDVRSPGAIAIAGTIPIIHGVDWKFENAFTESYRRVALADWIIRTDNPLTWRSIVNRIWHYHFGQGIVDTPNDFGRMGGGPSHPELLDWLAVEFRDGGDWIHQPQSIKDLHRLIVNSNVYKQSSYGDSEYLEIDKNNRFLWRMNRMQLDAESIRDSVLAVSGKLNTEMFGKPFKNFVVEKPEHSPHYVYEKSNPDDPSSHRRSIYRFVVRSQQQPLMNALNCADPNQRVAVRNQSNTVTQSLAMLNNQFVLAMSKHFANRLRSEHADLTLQVCRGFELVTGRKASQAEIELLHRYALEHGLEDTCRVLFNLNEFSFVD